VNESPLIAVFDLATVTGVCWGRAGTKPSLAIIDLRPAGTERPRRLARLYEHVYNFCRRYKPDKVRYESPVGIRGMMRIGATEETISMLRGLIGVLEAAASAAGVEDIGSFDVGDARQHLTGFRTFPRVKIPGTKRTKGTAKDAVMKACRALGIEVIDDNTADATCGFLYCSALANPRLAHLDTPLFGRR
jgi:hypothetical protein